MHIKILFWVFSFFTNPCCTSQHTHHAIEVEPNSGNSSISVHFTSTCALLLLCSALCRCRSHIEARGQLGQQPICNTEAKCGLNSPYLGRKRAGGNAIGNTPHVTAFNFDAMHSQWRLLCFPKVQILFNWLFEMHQLYPLPVALHFIMTAILCK